MKVNQMTRKNVWISLFCLLCFSFGFGRQAQGSNVVQALTNSISVGARFSFYGPKLDNISSAFDALEDTLGLSRAPEFKIFYLAQANVRYDITAQHSVSLELGLNLSNTKLGKSETIVRAYSLGAEYYYSLKNRRTDFYGLDAGAGAAWMVSNFERNYDVQRVSVLKKSVALNASIVGWVSPFRPLSIEVEARYLFVPSINVDYPQSTIKMSSVVLGAGISIAL